MAYPSSNTRNKRKITGLHINHIKNKRKSWLNWNRTKKMLVLFFQCSILFKYGFHAAFLTKLTYILSFSTTSCKGNSEIQLRFLHSFGQNICTVSFTSRHFVCSSCKSWQLNRSHICYWESCCTTQNMETGLCKIIYALTGNSSCLNENVILIFQLICHTIFSLSVLYPWN